MKNNRVVRKNERLKEEYASRRIEHQVKLNLETKPTSSHSKTMETMYLTTKCQVPTWNEKTEGTML